MVGSRPLCWDRGQVGFFLPEGETTPSSEAGLLHHINMKSFCSTEDTVKKIKRLKTDQGGKQAEKNILSTSPAIPNIR